MADKKITELDAATTPLDYDEIMELIQDSINHQVPISQLLAHINTLQFNTSPAPGAAAVGKVYWDATDLTLAIQQVIGTTQVVQQVGQEVQVLVRNNTGSDWPNGAVVYPTGSIAYRPTGALSQANVITKARAWGMATQPIANGATGFVTTFGMIRGFDTQTPGWAEGDFLYLSATVPGGLQKTPPTSGYTVRCAYVLRRHLTEGIVMFVPEPTPAFGDIAGGNYLDILFDGTPMLHGNATCYIDELQSLVGSASLESPAADFVRNPSECAIEAKKTARYPTDYVSMPLQLNHNWEPGTSIMPHLHWEQTTAATPHWLIGYRWQRQGQAKTTAWTNAKWTANAFTWSAGTLNQITEFGSIAPPVGYGDVSDIVEFRIYRDYTNVSGLFTGGDPVNASQLIINFDVHKRINSLGSREEYSK